MSAADQVEVFSRLLDHLGIDVLHAVVGPSVGGLIALTFATRFAGARPATSSSIASGFKTTVLNRLILFEQILAIENDPHFNGGDYYDGDAPLYGLVLARMISHKTFVHLDSIERRARQDVVQPDDVLAWYRVRDQFQSYMLHQGKKFVKRFDANTYLRIIDMWSRYDATEEGDAETPADLFERARLAGQKWLVFSIDSDFCFYPGGAGGTGEAPRTGQGRRHAHHRALRQGPRFLPAGAGPLHAAHLLGAREIGRFCRNPAGRDPLRPGEMQIANGFKAD